jgi:hypothetical protein
MADTLMESALHALRDGRIDFDFFAQATAPQWRALATRLFRRWTPPTGYSVEDTTQDLLLAAWSLVDKWDPTRGVPIGRYVIWNASDKAKKQLHVQRGAKRSGSADRNQTRGEFTIDTTKGYASREPWVHPAESQLEREQVAKELARGGTGEEATILPRLAVTLDWEGVAMEIYADPMSRLKFRLGNEAQARALVRRVIVSTATRVAVNAA